MAGASSWRPGSPVLLRCRERRGAALLRGDGRGLRGAGPLPPTAAQLGRGRRRRTSSRTGPFRTARARSTGRAPLARRGACGVAPSVPAAGVVLAAQLWALAGVLSVDGKRRNDRLARACLCILSLETVAVAASIVLRGRRGFSTDDRQNGGELGATLHCLSWLSLALGVRRLRASAAFPPAGAVDAFAPLWCAEALLVAALLHLYLRHRTGVYKLEKDQLAGALLYGVSRVAAGGQALFVRGHVQVAAVLLPRGRGVRRAPAPRARRRVVQLEASRGHGRRCRCAATPRATGRRRARGRRSGFCWAPFQRTRVDPPPPRSARTAPPARARRRRARPARPCRRGGLAPARADDDADARTPHRRRPGGLGAHAALTPTRRVLKTRPRGR